MSTSDLNNSFSSPSVQSSLDNYVSNHPDDSSLHISSPDSTHINDNSPLQASSPVHSSPVVSNSNHPSTNLWQDLPPDNDTLVSLHSDVDLDISSTNPFVRKSTRELKHPA